MSHSLPAHHLAKEMGEELIKNFPDNSCIAPVLLALATDELKGRNYDRCNELLQRVIKDFPQTHSAEQAKKIMERLSK